MVKRLTMWHTRPGVPREQAVYHWLTGHAALVLAVPGVGRYVQNKCIPAPGGTDPPYAGLGEVWFDSVDAAVESQDTPEWQTVIEDASTFMDLDQLVVAWAEEHTTPR